MRCDTCKYWDNDYYWNRWTYDDKGHEVMRKEERPSDLQEGKCRFNAPQLGVYDMSGGFKITKGKDWCGQWKERGDGT